MDYDGKENTKNLQKPKQSRRRENTRRKRKQKKRSQTTIYKEESVTIESNDEEILELRLEALSSKAEVKEIAEREGIENIQTLNMNKTNDGVIIWYEYALRSIGNV